MIHQKLIKRERRKARVKGKLKYDKPRLVAFRSLTTNYLHLVDDTQGKTLASASDLKAKKGTKTE
ncbi:50S ribosomal protein L18, partial [Candidatus Peregrinibacteria bacterium]|nr:50S ribosomal protein L18 [Candidatus Peregrinibacteria bacterium]